MIRNRQQAGVVFLVSSGSYSDYSVHFACPDKKTAQAMVKHLNQGRTYGEFEVEERPLYESVDQLTPVTWYRVEVELDGRERRRWEFTNRPWEDWYGESESGVAPAGFAYGISNRSYEVALKAARDAAAQHKAKKAGIS